MQELRLANAQGIPEARRGNELKDMGMSEVELSSPRAERIRPILPLCKKEANLWQALEMKVRDINPSMS
jgi:hypothetical protein